MRKDETVEIEREEGREKRKFENGRVRKGVSEIGGGREVEREEREDVEGKNFLPQNKSGTNGNDKILK